MAFSLNGLLRLAPTVSRARTAVMQGRRQGEEDEQKENLALFNEYARRRQLDQTDAAQRGLNERSAEKLANEQALVQERGKTAEAVQLLRNLQAERSRQGSQGDVPEAGMPGTIDRGIKSREGIAEQDRKNRMEIVIRQEAGRDRRDNDPQGGSGNLTEGNSKDYLFHSMLDRGNRNMEAQRGKIRPEAVHAYITKRWLKPALNEAEQMYVNGLKEFGAGVLRKETGAAFTDDELRDVYARYADLGLDSPELGEQKRAAREAQVETFRKMSEKARGVYDKPAPAGNRRQQIYDKYGIKP